MTIAANAAARTAVAVALCTSWSILRGRRKRRARNRYTAGARARIVSACPTICLDGQAPDHVARRIVWAEHTRSAS